MVGGLMQTRAAPTAYSAHKSGGLHAYLNSIQIVMLDAASNLTITFLANYQEILSSCPLAQFFIFKNILQVHQNVFGRGSKQMPHLRLAQPNSVLFL